MDENYVTQKECGERRDQITELITTERLKAAVIETKLNAIVWITSAIALAVISAAVTYVFSVLK